MMATENASILQELLLVNVETSDQDPLSLNAPSVDAQGCEVAKPGMRYCEEVDLTLSDDESQQQAEPKEKVEMLHCYRCVTGAMTVQSLELHMKVEHSFSWSTSNHYVESYRQFLKEVLTTICVKCIFCLKEFQKISTLLLHVLEEHFVCRICIRKFDSNTEFKRHISEHSRGEIKYLQCCACNAEYSNHKDAMLHYKSKHEFERFYKFKLLALNLNLKKSSNLSIDCPYCRYTCTELKSVLYHMTFHITVRCVTCNRNVAITNPLVIGGECLDCKLREPKFGLVENECKIDGTVKSRIKMVPCLVCEKKFDIDNLNSLHLHLIQEHPLKCKFCHHISQKEELAIHHLKSPSHSSFFCCAICKDTFINFTEFYSHFSTHSLATIEYSIKDAEYVAGLYFHIDKIKDKLQCPYCGCNTLSQGFLNHLQVNHNIRMCQFCTNLISFSEGKVVYIDGKEICNTCRSYQLRMEMKRKLTTVVEAPVTKQANVMITSSDTRHELFFIHSGSEQPASNGEQASSAVDPLQLSDDDVITLDDGPDSELKIEIHDEPLPENPILYQCTACSDSFSSLTLLGEHQREQHIINLICPFCTDCPTIFPNTDSLQLHVATSHPREETTSSSLAPNQGPSNTLWCINSDLMNLK